MHFFSTLAFGLILSLAAPAVTSFADSNDQASRPIAPTNACQTALAGYEAAWYADYPELDKMYQSALTLVHANDRPTLSIVVPAYREAKRIGDSIRQLRAFFNKFPYPVEIAVRIEKSPDNTVEVAREAAGDDPRITVYAHDVQRGKGYAVRQGMLTSHGDFVLFMDTDLSTPLPEIYRFLGLIAGGLTSDVLIGDRRSSLSQIEVSQSRLRRLMGSSFQNMVQMVLNSSGLSGIHDTQCGFKMFTNGSTQALFSAAKVDGFAFDIEILLLAAQLNKTVSAIPILWRDAAGSTVDPVRDSFRMAWDVIKMRRQVRRNLQQLGWVNP